MACSTWGTINSCMHIWIFLISAGTWAALTLQVPGDTAYFLHCCIIPSSSLVAREGNARQVCLATHKRYSSFSWFLHCTITFVPFPGSKRQSSKGFCALFLPTWITREPRQSDVNHSFPWKATTFTIEGFLGSQEYYCDYRRVHVSQNVLLTYPRQVWGSWDLWLTFPPLSIRFKLKHMVSRNCDIYDNESQMLKWV